MDCKTCQSCSKFKFHEWRYQCVNCRCPNYCHTSFANYLLNPYQDSLDWTEKISMQSHNQLNDYKSAMSMAKSNNLVWLPIGLQITEISKFLKIWKDSSETYSLERNKFNQMERNMTILNQIPKPDWISLLDIMSTDDELINRIEMSFMKNRDLNCLGFGELDPVDMEEKCINCHKEFIENDKYCIRITHSATYGSHLSCFKCKTCDQRLVDLHYCWDDETSDIYCLRHFGEIKFSRCSGCDKLIFNKEYTKAMEKEFHEEHFACSQCDVSLAGEKYILKNELPHCLKCYEENFGNSCDRCTEKIGCDSKDLSFNDRHWHDKCFFCDGCQNSLVDKTFATKEKDIYCPNCFDEKFSTRCSGCGEIFKSGIKKFDYGGKEWHEQCFVCDECKEMIGSKSFIPKNEKMICITCYDDKYAQRCFKCSEIIRKGGITYKGDPWHKECFLCAGCDKLLANIKFTSRDEKPYCPECFAELFSKRCKKCNKPITGFGGCKFVSLEDDNWHTECFTCSQCQSSLVGKGFLTHEQQLVCADCGNVISANEETN